MTLEEAREEYGDLGLTFEVGSQEASDEYDPGQIIDQDVEAGDMVASGTTIRVTVAADEEAEEVTVPNVVGDSSDSAMSTLEDAGLIVSREFQYDNSVEVGKVISQNPK